MKKSFLGSVTLLAICLNVTAHAGVMAHGWYLTSSQVITANWLAAPGQQWTVPIGGGFGRIFKMGDQPVSANIAAYYNGVRPTGVPNWQLRAELSLLFPER
jgi:hypothetical protein